MKHKPHGNYKPGDYDRLRHEAGKDAQTQHERQSSNSKGYKQRGGERKNCKNSLRTARVTAGTHRAITTVNVHGLNAPIKRESGWIHSGTETRPTHTAGKGDTSGLRHAA